MSVVKLLAAMSSLRVLTLNGNPVISVIPNYRKTMILECVSPDLHLINSLLHSLTKFAGGADWNQNSNHDDNSLSSQKDLFKVENKRLKVFIVQLLLLSISGQKSLTYLDNRPVTERDRACAEAWKRGGYAAEREEQERWIKAANRKTKEDINRLLQKRNDRGHQPPFKLVRMTRYL